MRLRFGMVGGGNGGNIGNSHRIGAQMDAMAVLSAGCLTRNHEQNKKDCEAWGIPEDRCYADYKEMAEKESAREDGIDFVSIVTPNKTHYPMVKCFLEHGISVVCEKPFTMTIQEGEELERIAKEHGCEIGIGYTYAHYPILRECKKLIETGAIGNIIDMTIDYPEDWMITALNGEGGAEFAKWMGDPKVVGNSNLTSGMGIHLYYLITSMTGLKMESVLADFGYYPSDAELETMTRFIFRLSNGAKGMGWSSNVAIGYDCTLIMRIFGDKGSITWSHDDPTRLRVAKLNSPIEIYNANKDYLCEESRNASRLPAGHPEGFHHAFANLYREFIRHLSDKKQGIIKDPSEYFYPKADEGVNGVRFVNACVASNKNGNVWIDLDKVTDEEAQI